MATDSTIVSPRIDTQFTVPDTGRLTQSGYALLYGLIRRTGGAVSGVIDAGAIEAEFAAQAGNIEAAQAAADEALVAADEALVAADEALALAGQGGEGEATRLAALHAEVAALVGRIAALEQGVVP